MPSFDAVYPPPATLSLDGIRRNGPFAYRFEPRREIAPGWSANLSATWKAAENDCLERRNSIRPCVPSHVAYKAERGGNELFWSPWKNVSTLARAAPKP